MGNVESLEELVREEQYPSIDERLDVHDRELLELWKNDKVRGEQISDLWYHISTGR